MSLLFLLSGVGKLSAIVATQAYMRTFGVLGVLVWPAAAWEIGGGVLLLIGLWARPLALLLAGWCLLTAIIFHTAFADQIMMMMFLKNMTMAGRSSSRPDCLTPCVSKRKDPNYDHDESRSDPRSEWAGGSQG
jgi:uncharacterized membrane protein YphA (DoxX/SURF4 family)